MSLDDSRTGWLTEYAWTMGLLLPFCLLLGAIRLAVDKLIPWNVDLDGASNLIGGGVCGLVSGVLTAGIVLLSGQYLRLGTEIMGWNAVAYESNGSLVHKSKVIPPADRMTAWFFSRLSDTTFRPISGDSLAKWKPDMADAGHLLRGTFPPPDGGGRQTIKPDAAEILGRYVFEPGNPKDLTTDSFDEVRNQTYNYVDGSSLSAGQSYIEGFVVRFKAGAKEKTGRIVVGSGHVRLIVRNREDTESMAIAPMAVISQAAGDSPRLGRWRFDAPNAFIASVGGRDDAPMAFEFPVPKGSKPLGLEVKGVRFDVRNQKPFATFTSMATRDAAILAGTITPTRAAEPLDESTAVVYPIVPNDTGAFIRMNDGLFDGLMIQKDNRKEIEAFRGGPEELDHRRFAKFNNNEIPARAGIDQRLQGPPVPGHRRHRDTPRRGGYHQHRVRVPLQRRGEHGAEQGPDGLRPQRHTVQPAGVHVQGQRRDVDPIHPANSNPGRDGPAAAHAVAPRAAAHPRLPRQQERTHREVRRRPESAGDLPTAAGHSDHALTGNTHQPTNERARAQARARFSFPG